MNTALYAKRRERLAKAIQKKTGSGVLLLNTASEKLRNRDSEYPYRHDSDFYYLTGFNEPGAYLVMQISEQGFQTHLFCRPKDLEREIWDGWRLGPEAAPEALGVDFAYPLTELHTRMPDLMNGFESLHTKIDRDLQREIESWFDVLRQQSRSGKRPPSAIHDVLQIVHEMRLLKDSAEIEIMRRSAKIAAQGHIRAMQACQPGMHEYHLEAELLYTFRKMGAQHVAYNSIVAAGKNACTLHHRAGDAQLLDGDLCFIDAGCELDSYASDITRTFPVNGQFSGPQKAIYEIVLEAQEKAISATRIGSNFQAPHEAALEVLTQGLLDLEILPKSKWGSVANAIEAKAYQDYYMHRTSHWLGMDVHDVGNYREPGVDDQPWRQLEAGMVLTIEPGLYIRHGSQAAEKYWGIGIRIEDDVHVTSADPEILTRDVPVTVSDIEALMRA